MGLITHPHTSHNQSNWGITMGEMINNIRLVWKLACMLKAYRTCNPTVGFWKYEFNNKLFSGVTFFRVTSSVTWSQSYIS